MNHRLGYLLVAGLACAAGPQATLSATTVRYQGAEVEIVVDGAAQRRYAHAGRWYIEALKGREYAIRLRNPYGVRVAVALSVDGLNTIDARETSAARARKWVLGPYETVTISGWQTSRTEARRFEFTSEEQSYGQALGKTDNLGTISAAFFRERTKSETAEYTGRRDTPAAPRSAEAQPPAAAAAGSGAEKRREAADNEYAATGIGRRTDHVVTQVWMDLEDAPAQTVNIRYEFRPQLVRLGILPAAPTTDPLLRRERARGFEPGFCPEPPPSR
jgi:hypothetical protein